MPQTIPAEQRLTIVFRVEAGCLGPQGGDHVRPFCTFAQPALAARDAGLIDWQVVPRDDKSEPEIQYLVAGRPLSTDQAGRYLALFGRDRAAFEDDLEGHIAELITRYQLQA